MNDQNDADATSQGDPFGTGADVHFPQSPNWRIHANVGDQAADEADDDEELENQPTPQSVVAVLGFDPEDSDE